eukprot:TRINITY_DN35437_c0_g1_i1.p1 TRINITY_DN35437_c0_g1~~TRINITY_DN35437_c0_g1_i1.p1  ORF type:complete len:918 (+),score=115.51 TRINITY_DN35437_c0_g1_i1:124-2877(+)
MPFSRASVRAVQRAARRVEDQSSVCAADRMAALSKDPSEVLRFFRSTQPSERTSPVYTAVIAACSGKHSGLIQHVPAILAEMRTRSIEPSPSCVLAAVDGLQFAGRWREALGLCAVHGGPSRSVSVTQGAIIACAGGGRWRNSLGLVAGLRQRSLHTDYLASAAAIRAADAATAWQAGFRLFNQVGGDDTPDALATAGIRVMQKGLLWRQALRLAHSKGISRYVKKQGMQICVEAANAGGGLGKAIQVLGQMDGSGGYMRGPVLREQIHQSQWTEALRSFSRGLQDHIADPGTEAVMLGLEMTSRWAFALKVYEDLPERRRPAELLSVCVRCLQRSGDKPTEKVAEFIAAARDMAREVSPLALSTAVRQHQRTRSWRRGLGLVQHERSTATVNSYHVLSAVSATLQAESLWRRSLILSKHLPASRFDRSEKSVVEASALTGASEWRRALSVATTPQTAAAVVGALDRADLSEQAVDLIDHCRRNTIAVDAAAPYTVGTACARLTAWRLALGTMQTAREAGKESDRVYRAIVSSLRNPDSVRKLIDYAPAKLRPLSSYFYAAAVKACGRESLDGALEVLSFMQADGVVAGSDVWRGLLDACERGDVEHVLRRMQEYGFVPDTQCLLAALSIFAQDDNECGRDCIELVRNMGFTVPAEIYRTALRHACARSLQSDAEELACELERMDELRLQNMAMACACLLGGRQTPACVERWMSHLEQRVLGLPDDVLKHFVVALTLTQDHRRIEEVSRQALASPESHVGTLGALARVLVDSGRVEDARKHHTSMVNAGGMSPPSLLGRFAAHCETPQQMAEFLEPHTRDLSGERKSAVYSAVMTSCSRHRSVGVATEFFEGTNVKPAVGTVLALDPQLGMAAEVVEDSTDPADALRVLGESSTQRRSVQQQAMARSHRFGANRRRY